jgi:hypothetical protein
MAWGCTAEGLGAGILKRYRVKGNVRMNPVRISFNGIEAYVQRNDKERGNEKRKVECAQMCNKWKSACSNDSLLLARIKVC